MGALSISASNFTDILDNKKALQKGTVGEVCPDINNLSIIQQIMTIIRHLITINDLLKFLKL
jgi:predicted XRE-type DNA-binding protein